MEAQRDIAGSQGRFPGCAGADQMTNKGEETIWVRAQWYVWDTLDEVKSEVGVL